MTGPANNPTVNLTWTDNSLKEAGFTVQRATDANFTTGLTTFNVAASAGAEHCDICRHNRREQYRLLVQGVRNRRSGRRHSSLSGFSSASPPCLPTLFPTHSRSWSGPPTTAVPADPTLLTATVQAGPQVSLTWRDNATNETGFAVERCTGAPARCTNFAQIAAPGPRNDTGNVTYVDTTVTAGNTYRYQVWAVNAVGRSASSYERSQRGRARDSGGSYQFHSIGRESPNGTNYTATLTWAGRHQPNQLHDPARHQRHVHDRPEHLHGCGPPPGVSRRP